MHVRSKEELSARLDEFSKNRKRELITLKHLLSKGRGHERRIARRTAVVLSYAHWEGFVKDASMTYVEYVAFISPIFSSLTDNFQAIVCRTLLRDAAKATKRIQPHLEIVRQFTDFHSQKARIDSQAAIDTESNLSWDVFENICKTIGIDYSFWYSYGPFINDFVESRCAIATENFFRCRMKNLLKKSLILSDAINRYKTDIENAVIMEHYLR